MTVCCKRVVVVAVAAGPVSQEYLIQSRWLIVNEIGVDEKSSSGGKERPMLWLFRSQWDRKRNIQRRLTIEDHELEILTRQGLHFGNCHIL